MRRSLLPIATLSIALACAGCGGGPAATAPGAAAPAAPAGLLKTAPDFELTDLNGKLVRLSDSKGTVRLVDFWATWCAPCREEIPMFRDLSDAYGAKGFNLVGIAMDNEGLSVVKPFVEENHVTFLTLLGNEAVATSYGPLVGFPSKFLIDREGKIVASWVGPVPRAVLEQKIQSLL
jgi:cytochrome c biogenesis protein CcmG/thiol:disulfide interchange protein DsbE